ncbi:hypothetical protein [Desulfosporosinus sp. OT]|uniref:hypothetical protein n=1 Tax=Desulfosporosinus sp. OT TaxID=913865 RepID=UPI000223A49E|nr:hypothetical protein [Desulfosporosinus sp. OT]EGW37851.1 hypothetical protein DOT_4259 [Desulfosporosinus sp. OT]
MKMQNLNSVHSKTTMTFQLNGTGFEPDAQQQINQTAMFVNNAKLECDVKTKSNTQKTISKSKMVVDYATEGMTMNIPLWVESDLTGSAPKITEIIKLPPMATAVLPPQFASKEYMVLSPTDMSGPATGSIDMTKLMNFNKDFHDTFIKFLNSYSQRFNPSIDVTDKGIQHVTTRDGSRSARIYELKLNDAQFKDFIRYTVNNFVQDEEAMDFVKEFITQVIELNQIPDNTNSLNDFSQEFDKFKADRPQFLVKFNNIMDQLNKTTLLGDKGIDLQYAISNGYIVQEIGTIDFKFNVAQIAQLMNTLSGNQTASLDGVGTLNLQINYSTTNSGINDQIEIQIPKVNTTNSFNYLDLMNSNNLLVPEKS